jgi:hypothetical protein
LRILFKSFSTDLLKSDHLILNGGSCSANFTRKILRSKGVASTLLTTNLGAGVHRVKNVDLIPVHLLLNVFLFIILRTLLFF